MPLARGSSALPSVLLADFFNRPGHTVRRYIETGDVEPKEGNHAPMKLHDDYEQQFLLTLSC